MIAYRVIYNRNDGCRRTIVIVTEDSTEVLFRLQEHLKKYETKFEIYSITRLPAVVAL